MVDPALDRQPTPDACCQSLSAAQAGFRSTLSGLRDLEALTSFARALRGIELSECWMADLKADVLVLGAGMVGVGAALHLQKRGRNVMLIDRHRMAGEEARVWKSARVRWGAQCR